MIKYDDTLMLDLAPKRFGKTVKKWLIFLVIMLIIAIYFYYLQIKKGLVVTNLNDYFSWGIYTSNFIFFVSISFVGSLTGSFLRMANFHWRIPVVRITEIIAIIALLMASISIILDLGRPDRLLYMIRYGRIQSPIIWDVIIVASYMVMSILMLYLSLIPDFAILKNFFYDKPRLRKVYTFLSIKWRAKKEQRKLRRSAINIITSLIIPVSLLHQTSNGWLFATTYRVGWNSAVIGPYFITGAILIGFAVIITVMYSLCKLNRLEKYITPLHFNNMGVGLGVSAAAYLYFNFSIYFLPLYTSTISQLKYTSSLFTGKYALLFWLVFIGISILPTITLVLKKWRRPKTIFYISIIVMVASWFKRYLIIIPTLETPFLPIQGVPKEWYSYSPSFIEAFITLTTFTTAILLIALFARFIPIIGIHDYAVAKRLIEQDKK
jgi:Ni/Fe-hydrogenase subunit HybB-like protein